MKQSVPKSIDEYIAAQPEAVRPKLEQVRAAIRRAVPEAVEGIGYRMPGYKLHGKPMLYFAAFKEHYSLFAASGTFFAALEDELRGYELRNQEHSNDWTWVKIRAEKRAGAGRPAISPECGGVRQSGRNLDRDAQAMVASTGLQSGLSGGPPGGGLTDQCPHAGEFWRLRLGVVQTDGGPTTPPSIRARTAQCVLECANRSLELEDIEVRLARLEQNEQPGRADID